MSVNCREEEEKQVLHRFKGDRKKKEPVVSLSPSSHLDQEVQGPVPHGDEGVPAEDDALPPLGGDRELGEDDAGQAGLHDDPEDALGAHDHNGKGAFFRRGPGRRDERETSPSYPAATQPISLA